MSINWKVPAGVSRVLERLDGAGFEACLVGGCVRDALLNLPCQDYDVASSARPEEVKGLFCKTYDTGIRYGTVTVAEEGEKVEVTTFRVDLPYTGHRRPEGVSYSRNLGEDLSRRDFTVNAMAWHPKSGLIDPFGGQKDLSLRLIRCVGEADKRFEEDALRMLRAVRFCARLGFTLEENTKAAISRNSPLAAGLSPERVRAELTGVLASPRPAWAFSLLSFGLLDAYLKKTGAGLTLPFAIGVPPRGGELSAVLACFFAYLTEAGAISSVPETLSSLRFDRRTGKETALAVALLLMGSAKAPAALKERLYRFGIRAVETGLLAEEYRGGKEAGRAWLAGIIEKEEPYLPSHLALTPQEIGDMGYRGGEIKEAIEKLLGLCWEEPERNDREYLLAQLKNKS